MEKNLGLKLLLVSNLAIAYVCKQALKNEKEISGTSIDKLVFYGKDSIKNVSSELIRIAENSIDKTMMLE